MAKETLRWGIIATGSIAWQFAQGLAVSRTGRLAAVASRDVSRARAFADEQAPAAKGGEIAACGSRDELLARDDVDAVYIATPHHLHRDDTIAAARAGKGILCEKPFCLNERETREGLAAVEAAGVFFMEAFMYRVSPQMTKVRELIAAGALGDVHQVNAEFGFAAGMGWTNFRTDAFLGGGGLMDVGGYCVSLARMAFGSEPVGGAYIKGMDANGYDGAGAGLLEFPGGRALHFGTGIHLGLRNDARLYGTEGWLHIEDPWKSGPGGALTLHRDGGNESWNLGLSNAELYAAEADAVAAHFDEGECPAMTKADSLGQTIALDRLRASAGMRFHADEVAFA